MEEYQAGKEENKHILREDPVPYGIHDAQEEKRLKEALKRTDSEKFHFLMTLMKMGTTMRKAVIHHKK